MFFLINRSPCPLQFLRQIGRPVVRLGLLLEIQIALVDVHCLRLLDAFLPHAAHILFQFHFLVQRSTEAFILQHVRGSHDDLLSLLLVALELTQEDHFHGLLALVLVLLVVAVVVVI